METVPHSDHKVEISWNQFATGNFPETPERRMFRQAVAAAMLRAQDEMPDANGRVERARDLVLTGAVAPQPDGTFIVKGLGGNGKDYLTTQHTCTCPDQAKGYTCKHRIALWIWRTARATVEEQAAPPEPPAFLPEAPASCNVFVTLAGRKVHITLRDHDENRMLDRLDAVLSRFPLEEAQPAVEAVPAPEPEAMQEPVSPASEPVQEEPPAQPPKDERWCDIHRVAMTLRTNQRGSWYSHPINGGGFCKGCIPRR